MLDAYVSRVERMPGVGDVAGRIHVGGVGRECLVDHDAVVGPQPGGLCECCPRRNADSHDYEVASDRGPVAGFDLLHGAVPFEALDSRTREQPHAVLEMDVAVDRPDVRAEHPLQRHRSGLDHRHLGAPLARRGGELGSDPACADHDHAAGGIETFAQGVAVGERPQIVHAAQLGSCDRDPARLGAGRQ